MAVNRRNLYWIVQAGGHTLYLLLYVVLYVTSPDPVPTELLSFVLLTVFYFFATNIYRGYIHKRKWLKVEIGRLIPKVLLASFVLTLLSYVVAVLLGIVMGINTPTFYISVLFIVPTMASSFGIFLLWSIIYFLFHYVDNYNQTLKYEAIKNEIELNQLKSQLNPHFIFNALNSIRALVGEDPIKAKQAITQLSGILRNSLYMDKKKLILFEDELATVKDYIDLETIRFEERLQSEFIIHPDSGKFEVPPLMIQTLVENGIKHGISNLTQGGILQVKTELKNHKLAIQIRNSGQYKEPKRETKQAQPAANGKGSGYGIQNTKQRLKLIFGNAASFSIQNENSENVLTEVVIPQNI